MASEAGPGSRGPDWLNPFHSQYDALETSLSPQECSNLLQAQLGKHLGRSWFYDCSNPLIGLAMDDGFDISRCIPYINPFRTWVAGNLVREPQRTVISCRTAVKRSSLAGAPFVLFLLSFFGLLFLHDFVRTAFNLPGLSQLDVLTVLKVALLPYLGTVFLRLYLARGDRQYLLRFLKRTLHAQDAPSPVVAPDGGSVDARQLYRKLNPPLSARTLLIVAVVLVAIIVALGGLIVWAAYGCGGHCIPL